MTKLIMHGCNGKMGQVISKIVKEDPNVEMAAGIDAYTGIANDYPVFESIEKCDIKADAIIDFSNAAAVDGLLDYCVEKQVPVVHYRVIRGAAKESRRDKQESCGFKICEYVIGSQYVIKTASGCGKSACTSGV